MLKMIYECPECHSSGTFIRFLYGEMHLIVDKENKVRDYSVGYTEEDTMECTQCFHRSQINNFKKYITVDLTDE